MCVRFSLSITVLLLGPSCLHGLEPVPDKLVVMTFDDSVRSHYTVARPALKACGFGATFFVTEGFTFKTNKKDYMTWEEIRQLHADGFEIGNHTGSHMAVGPKTVARLAAELRQIDEKCARWGIPKPVSFAWPGNQISPEGLAVLGRHGIEFARRGGNPERDQWSGKGYAYEPDRDHRHLIPSVAVPLPGWTLDDLIAAVREARDGRVAVVQFHGVPEGEHDFVSTPQTLFEEFVAHLRDQKYQVIALRDLRRYVDLKASPQEPWAVIKERLAQQEAAAGVKPQPQPPAPARDEKAPR